MVAQLDKAYLRAGPSKALVRLLSYTFFEGRPVTTRGRWINPLVFSHFALEKRLPILKTVEKPLFILGNGRTGTTVLGMVLSMHRDVGFLNEPKALWHAIYAGEDVIGNYTSKTARFRLGRDDVTDKAEQNAKRLFGAYLAVTRSARLLNKYPELIFRVPFVRALFPDARFILLVRNGKDTISSIASWSDHHKKRHHEELHDWWGVNDRKWTLMCEELVASDEALSGMKNWLLSLTSHQDRAAIEWIITMRIAIELLEQKKPTLMIVRYEDLVTRPRRVVSEILNFAELAKDERCLDYGKFLLRPGKSCTEVGLHERIQPLFNCTMASLGY